MVVRKMTDYFSVSLMHKEDFPYAENDKNFCMVEIITEQDNPVLKPNFTYKTVQEET